MTDAEKTLAAWLTAAAAGFVFNVLMVCITLSDYRAALGDTDADQRGKRQIGRMFLTLASFLLFVQSSFLATAFGGLLGVSPAILRLILSVGSLGVGLSAVVWYIDRRIWQRRRNA